MTKDDVLFGYRQQLFAEAARTSVSAACRTFGVHEVVRIVVELRRRSRRVEGQTVTGSAIS